MIPDPEDARSVLGAFRAAAAAGDDLVACYLAGAAAWRARHPDHHPEYAAQAATSVILRARVPSLEAIASGEEPRGRCNISILRVAARPERPRRRRRSHAQR